jgi:putative transposase
MMLFGEDSLQYVLNAYVDHDHRERHHQGKGHVLLLPPPRPGGEDDSPIQCRERLGGLLKDYAREAA